MSKFIITSEAVEGTEKRALFTDGLGESYIFFINDYDKKYKFLEFETETIARRNAEEINKHLNEDFKVEEIREFLTGQKRN